ncbi:hypothetical protein LSTR_LSTR014878, partial [Laodelphax striatellus]
MRVLDVTRHGPSSDNSIIGFEYHSHAPYTITSMPMMKYEYQSAARHLHTAIRELSTFGVYCEGAENAAVAGSPCVSGFFANLWSEIRYEINGVEVDGYVILELP